MVLRLVAMRAPILTGTYSFCWIKIRLHQRMLMTIPILYVKWAGIIMSASTLFFLLKKNGNRILQILSLRM